MDTDYGPEFEKFWDKVIVPWLVHETPLLASGREAIKPLFYRTWCAANTAAVLGSESRPSSYK